MSYRPPSSQRRLATSCRLTVAAAVALAAAAAASAADLAQIQASGTLKVLVVVDTKRPEFYSLSADKPGFDAEILQGFAHLHRLGLQFVPVSGWDALIPALNEGKGDVIAGRFTATEARSRLVSFTHEVFPTRNVVFNLKPRPPVTSLDALRKEKLGVIHGSSMAEAARAAGLPEEAIDSTVAPGAYAEALHAGRITAALWGVESAIALQREDPDIQLGMFLGPHASLAYAVRKDSPELLKALDEYIDNFRRTPSWSRLVVKYFGSAAPDVLKKARSE